MKATKAPKGKRSPFCLARSGYLGRRVVHLFTSTKTIKPPEGDAVTVTVCSWCEAPKR